VEPSLTTQTHVSSAPEVEHPPPKQYVQVAIALAAVTAVEVGLYYTDLGGYWLVAILMVLAVVKFAMVAAYFMHLKFDSILLRRFFVTGIILAICVFTVYLLTLDVLLH
jgi:cytochrome c oxidase subunit 4